MKEFIELFKTEILICCFCLLAFALAVAAAVILIPPETAVIVTDTGYILERNDGIFTRNYKIFEETKTIVIIENGEYTSYKYNNWYMLDHIQGKSFWQRWTEK